MRTITISVAMFCLTGSMAVAQTTSSILPIPAGRYGAIGCLTREGNAAAPRYVVTDKRSKTVYRVDGDRELLARHVSHTVEVAGTLTRSAGTSRYTMKMVSLVWMASSCEPTR